MITYVEGRLDDKQPTRAVLDVGGMGYEIFIPLSSYDRLPSAGGTVRLLVHDHVREDQHLLFGFMTEGERRMFGLLTSISGIGPRLALSALSSLTVRELTAAVVDGDVRRLNGISGVGKKTAERLVVELRDKISDADALEAAAGADEGGTATPVARDAMLALVALGYKQDDARKMVQRVAGAGDTAGKSVEDIIREALSR